MLPNHLFNYVKLNFLIRRLVLLEVHLNHLTDTGNSEA